MRVAVVRVKGTNGGSHIEEVGQNTPELCGRVGRSVENLENPAMTVDANAETEASFHNPA